MRTVVAPSRCLQNAAKSCRPTSRVRPRLAAHRAAASQRAAPPARCPSGAAGPAPAVGRRAGSGSGGAAPRTARRTRRARGGRLGPGCRPAARRPAASGSLLRRPVGPAGQRGPPVDRDVGVATCPRAWTPASVRPATVSRTGSGARSTVVERPGQLPLDGAAAGLRGPPGEVRAVVREVDPHAQDLGLAHDPRVVIAARHLPHNGTADDTSAHPSRPRTSHNVRTPRPQRHLPHNVRTPAAPSDTFPDNVRTPAAPSDTFVTRCVSAKGVGGRARARHPWGDGLSSTCSSWTPEVLASGLGVAVVGRRSLVGRSFGHLGRSSLVDGRLRRPWCPRPWCPRPWCPQPWRSPS